MRELRALRTAGRARRVKDDRDVVGILSNRVSRRAVEIREILDRQRRIGIAYDVRDLVGRHARVHRDCHSPGSVHGQARQEE